MLYEVKREKKHLHGTQRLTVGWPDEPTAEQIKLVDEFMADPATELKPGDRITARRIGKSRWTLWFVTGPPTWWLPRVKIKTHSFDIGWIRAMVGIHLEKKKDENTQT
jgi:hypothetical protein